MRYSSLLSIKALALLVFCGCGGSHSTAEAAPGPNAEAPTSAAEPTPPGTSDAPARAALTAEACTAAGGTVVGDIGDGAIHRAEYRCANGSEPSGNIVPEAGGPIAVEGSVCCPR